LERLSSWCLSFLARLPLLPHDHADCYSTRLDCLLISVWLAHLWLQCCWGVGASFIARGCVDHLTHLTRWNVSKPCDSRWVVQNNNYIRVTLFLCFSPGRERRTWDLQLHKSNPPGTVTHSHLSTNINPPIFGGLTRNSVCSREHGRASQLAFSPHEGDWRVMLYLLMVIARLTVQSKKLPIMVACRPAATRSCFLTLDMPRHPLDLVRLIPLQSPSNRARPKEGSSDYIGPYINLAFCDWFSPRVDVQKCVCGCCFWSYTRGIEVLVISSLH
jgi:hypothetical protein